MDQQALFAAIDRSIRNVADTEFKRLAAEMNADAWFHHVHSALESLGSDGLRQGVPPDYNDDWVALFYLTWHQAGQINLIHSLIEKLNQVRSSNTLIANYGRFLHVIDFGCGALAMQFAIAWAAAEALEGGADIESIRVESRDPALPMVRLGIQLWKEFKLEISREKRLRELSYASEEVIKLRYGKPDSGLLFKDHQADAERWLSAIHTVYESNLEQVQQSLFLLANELEPTNSIMSCRNNSASNSFLVQASPFPVKPWFEGPMISHINGLLPEVTLWRRSLNEHLRRQGFNGHNFLNGDVTWRFPQAFGRIYNKLV